MLIHRSEGPSGCTLTRLEVETFAKVHNLSSKGMVFYKTDILIRPQRSLKPLK